MARFKEYCPLGLTDTVIEFNLEGRKPSPSTPCICGGLTPAGQTVAEAAF